jgi:stalled ribosome rescue protein Dom34
MRRKLAGFGEILHQNIYENWFTESQVVDGVEDVKKLIEKLKQLVK